MLAKLSMGVGDSVVNEVLLPPDGVSAIWPEAPMKRIKPVASAAAMATVLLALGTALRRPPWKAGWGTDNSGCRPFVR